MEYELSGQPEHVVDRVDVLDRDPDLDSMYCFASIRSGTRSTTV